VTKTIEVEVYGQRFSIQGDADESYFHELAGYVDGQMRKLAETMKTGTPSKLAILAAINITDQLFQQERRRQAGEAEIERRTMGMLERIEQNL
jgi:cell division protein ZapA